MNTAECGKVATSLALLRYASMEPPCEHGGVSSGVPNPYIASQMLQWSRRVNTAEWPTSSTEAPMYCIASMEPPCEHGGVRLVVNHRPERASRFNGAAV